MKTYSIINNKGGVGKSTLTGLVATFMANHCSKKVAIIDTDEYSNSLEKVRENELKYYKTLPTVSSKVLKAIENMPTVVNCLPSEAQKKYDEFEKEHDICFFIFPSNFTKEKHLIKIFLNLNHILVPIMSDQLSINTSINFLKDIKAIKAKNGVPSNIDSYHFFINQYAPYKNKSMVQFIEEKIPEVYKFPKLQNNVYEATRYKNLSTIIPIEHGDILRNFVAEILSL